MNWWLAAAIIVLLLLCLFFLVIPTGVNRWNQYDYQLLELDTVWGEYVVIRIYQPEAVNEAEAKIANNWAKFYGARSAGQLLTHLITWRVADDSFALASYIAKLTLIDVNMLNSAFQQFNILINQSSSVNGEQIETRFAIYKLLRLHTEHITRAIISAIDSRHT